MKIIDFEGHSIRADRVDFVENIEQYTDESAHYFSIYANAGIIVIEGGSREATEILRQQFIDKWKEACKNT